MKTGESEKIAENMISIARAFFVMRMREQGVKPPSHDPSYWVMGMLPRRGLPISEIGRRLSRSKPSMTALIDKLIREGRVRRVPDKLDRRVTNIVLTEKGKQFMQCKKCLVRDIISANLSHLGPRKLEKLRSALEEANSIINSDTSD
ncbi:MarR family protein [uncultured archaeon]|nr:MarR family protein [uncultured archaeon]